MWMDTKNRVTQDEVFAPLSHDAEGVFARSGQKYPPKKYPLWLDTTLVVLFVSFLYGIDFILFSGSGNFEVFQDSVFPIPEISVILLLIPIFIALFIVPFHSKKTEKYIVASILTFCCIYILFKQFFQYHQQFSIGMYTMPISVFVGLVISSIIFVIFQQEKALYKVLLIVASAVMFGNVYYTYYSKNSENHGFEETHNTQRITQESQKIFIYFLLPNFTSSAYLSAVNDEETQKTNKLIQGFYQFNNFKVFTQVYTPEYTYLENMVRAFNPTSDKSSKQHVMATKKLDSYWRFYNLRKEHIFLQNNELYDYFKEKDYQISAYKSRGFEMCLKRYDYNVNRCVEKVNKPADLAVINLPLSTKVGGLFIEWISSIFSTNSLMHIYKFLSEFNILPLDGTYFDNLYILSSLNTLDILSDNIAQDTGKQAYFVFMDMPSNMYVYDEFCHIKNPNEWQNMTDMPWKKDTDNAQRRNAYLQQTKCLLGRLNKFISDLKNDGKLENTTILIQGISGISDFRKNTEHDSVIDQFIYDRTVNMAIYEKKKKKTDKQSDETDNRFCVTNQIVAEYLFENKPCNENLSDLHEKTHNNLKNRLNKLTEYNQDDQSHFFEKWYANWLNNTNVQTQKYNTHKNMQPSDKQEIYSQENVDLKQKNKIEDFGIDDLY